MLKLTPQQTAAALDCLRADRITGGEDRPLTAIDELVWRTLYFTFRNRKTGACWPSLQTIADVSGCCRRTVSHSIKRLRKAGWLRWYRKRKHRVGWQWTQAPNDYELVLPRRWRRTVAERKACARTTSIFTKVAAGHLMRAKAAPKSIKPPAKPDPTPPGYGSNSLAMIEDDALRASLARLGAAIAAKHAQTSG